MKRPGIKSLEIGLQRIDQQSLAADSAAGRKATWVSFINRLQDHGTSLTTADANELKAAALEHRNGPRPKEHARRLLRLAESVIDHLQVAGQLPKGRNPATEARFSLNVNCQNDLTVFLTPAQIEGLFAVLDAQPDPADALKDYRDRAILALALGAGAPPTAISVTTVSCIQQALTSGEIRLNALQPTGKRPDSWSACLLPAAQKALSAYLVEVSDAPADALAFPGRQERPMSRVQIFRLIRERLWATGLFSDKTRLSPQTLRNAYFGLLCEAGHSSAQVSASMGWVLGDQEQFRRMRRYWQQFRQQGAMPADGPTAA
ncbi:MAG: hypothetical protein ACM3X0_03030 [Bacteroidota bacterium]